MSVEANEGSSGKMTAPICPACSREGHKPEWIQAGHSSTTLMDSRPYWDKQGRYHDHNPNTIMTSYSCSMGHKWSETTEPPSCPSCIADEEEKKK